MKIKMTNKRLSIWYSQATTPLSELESHLTTSTQITQRNIKWVRTHSININGIITLKIVYSMHLLKHNTHNHHIHNNAYAMLVSSTPMHVVSSLNFKVIFPRILQCQAEVVNRQTEIEYRQTEVKISPDRSQNITRPKSYPNSDYRCRRFFWDSPWYNFWWIPTRFYYSVRFFYSALICYSTLLFAIVSDFSSIKFGNFHNATETLKTFFIQPKLISLLQNRPFVVPIL